jgi:hypothetical protein
MSCPRSRRALDQTLVMPTGTEEKRHRYLNHQ